MPETTLLAQRIEAARQRVRPHNLPPQPTPFLGRQAELGHLHRLLADPTQRLVTVLGPGGIGKTRLALEAADAQGYAFLDGVYWVPLAGVESVEAIAPAIAHSVGFTFLGKETPRQALLRFLQEREMLLLLDNMEHLLDGIDLLLAILERAPRIKLLVTSRERLGVRWESRVLVDGFDTPPEDDETAIDGFAAVRLFAQSAERVSPGFRLEAHAVGVARICRLLEGMPLGLELAASAVDHHPPDVIARQIERTVGSLATTMRDVPARHRSLRAVFDHSWALLSATEQRLFEALSTFRGGFTNEAATHLMQGEVTWRERGLERLVAKSLLRPTGNGRYEIHEVLRQFAAERLAMRPDSYRTIRNRHSHYYLSLLHESADHLVGVETLSALQEFRTELDNIRSAWRWAIQQADLDLLAEGTDGLARFYVASNLTEEGEAALWAAIESVRAQAAPRLLARLLVRQARLLHKRGHYEEGLGAAREGIALAETHDQSQTAALGYLFLGTLAGHLGDPDAARAAIERGRAVAHEHRDRKLEADCLRGLGNLCYYRGEPTPAMRYYEASLQIAEEIGDIRGQAASIGGIGLAYALQDEPAQARSYLEELMRLNEIIGDQSSLARSLDALGDLARGQGDLAAATDHYERALHIFREIGDQQYEADALNGLGAVATAQGRYKLAEGYLRQARHHYEARRDAWGLGNVHHHLGKLAHLQGDTQSARTLLEEALRHRQQLGDQRGIAETEALLLHLPDEQG